MCAGGVGRLIGIQCGERSVLDVRDSFQADGLGSGCLMFEEMVHVGLHVEEVAEHLRCCDDARDGDSLMPVDVTIHTGEIDERRGEAADQQDDDQTKRDGEFLADGEASNPADGRATHGERYHSTAGTASGSMATAALAHDNLPALVPEPEDGQIRVDGIDGILACHGKLTADGD